MTCVVKTESRSSVYSVCIKHGGLKKTEQQDGNKWWWKSHTYLRDWWNDSDSSSLVRHLCHCVDVVITSMDCGPMPNTARVSSPFVGRVSFRSWAGRIVSQHSLVIQNFSYSSCRSFCFFVRERALGGGHPYSQTQWSAIFLYWFSWVFVYAVMKQGPTYPWSKRCFFLPTMQHS